MDQLSTIPAATECLNDTHQDDHLMIEKAKSLIAEQGYLIKERQRLTLELRHILGISRSYRTR